MGLRNHAITARLAVGDAGKKRVARCVWRSIRDKGDLYDNFIHEVDRYPINIHGRQNKLR